MSTARGWGELKADGWTLRKEPWAPGKKTLISWWYSPEGERMAFWRAIEELKKRRAAPPAQAVAPTNSPAPWYAGRRGQVIPLGNPTKPLLPCCGWPDHLPGCLWGKTMPGPG